MPKSLQLKSVEVELVYGHNWGEFFFFGRQSLSRISLILIPQMIVMLSLYHCVRYNSHNIPKKILNVLFFTYIGKNLMNRSCAYVIKKSQRVNESLLLLNLFPV